MLKNRKYLLVTLISVFGLWSHPFFAQQRHYDFLGAGHQNEISVTSSAGDGSKTISGFPIQNPDQVKDAARFLAQATFGADLATIQMTAAMGYPAWLDEQFALPMVSQLEVMMDIAALYEVDASEIALESEVFRHAWMTANLTSPALLRERMAFSLSQIFVASDRDPDIGEIGQPVAQYYDILSSNAFSNYKDLIKDITYSSVMARYLTYLENPKANPEENIQPDENYAREIMQLFSIGLWELNPYGSLKRDSNGEFIPTYDNQDIDEFAKVFTGLVDDERGEEIDYDNLSEQELMNIFMRIRLRPLVMDQDIHETAEKRLLNGFVIPANQPGDVDVDQTLSHLSTHPNTAPFISKALIQFLTTSNPSQTYVRDVAATFNGLEKDNFQAVIRAILLHPEARATPTEHYSFGKLKEPVFRWMNLLKAFPLSANNTRGHYADEVVEFYDYSGQAPLWSPSVFNFFNPSYQPQGEITTRYLVAPEFQILNASNSLGFVNFIDERFEYESILSTLPEAITEEGEDDPLSYSLNQPNVFDFSKEHSLAFDPRALINHLDMLLAQGQLSDDTKNIIQNAITQLEDTEDRVTMAIYLIMLSPDAAILK